MHKANCPKIIRKVVGEQIGVGHGEIASLRCHLILPAVVGHRLRVSLLQDFGTRVQDFFPGLPANEQAMLGSNSSWPSRCKNGRSLPAG